MKIYSIYALILLLATLPLAGCNESEANEQPAGPPAIIEKAIAASDTVQSYRAVLETSHAFDGKQQNDVVQIEFVAPDRYWQTSIHDGVTSETIRIGKREYGREDGAIDWRISEQDSEIEFPPRGPGMLIRFMADEPSLSIDGFSWSQQPDANIDGTQCQHFSGELDMNKAVDAMIDNLRKADGKLDDAHMQSFERMRQNQQTIELWIGVDDYLVRQEKSVSRSLVPGQPGEEDRWIDASLCIQFRDFNAPIVIESPENATPWNEVPHPVETKSRDELD